MYLPTPSLGLRADVDDFTHNYAQSIPIFKSSGDLRSSGIKKQVAIFPTRVKKNKKP